jgi:hypothetical protein
MSFSVAIRHRDCHGSLIADTGWDCPNPAADYMTIVAVPAFVADWDTDSHMVEKTFAVSPSAGSCRNGRKTFDRKQPVLHNYHRNTSAPQFYPILKAIHPSIGYCNENKKAC